MDRERNEQEKRYQERIRKYQEKFGVVDEGDIVSDNDCEFSVILNQEP